MTAQPTDRSLFISALDATHALGGGDEGRQILFQAHSDGRITMTGRIRSSEHATQLGSRKDIPTSAVFDSLTIDATNCLCARGEDEDFARFEDNQGIRWEDVKIAKPSFDRLLRAIRGAVNSKASSEARCRKWLEGEMRKHNSAPRRKEQYRQEGILKFSVTSRAFHRAWTAAIEETQNTNWSRPGRKRSPVKPTGPAS